MDVYRFERYMEKENNIQESRLTSSTNSQLYLLWLYAMVFFLLENAILLRVSHWFGSTSTHTHCAHTHWIGNLLAGSETRRAVNIKTSNFCILFCLCLFREDMRSAREREQQQKKIEFNMNHTYSSSIYRMGLHRFGLSLTHHGLRYTRKQTRIILLYHTARCCCCCCN